MSLILYQFLSRLYESLESYCCHLTLAWALASHFKVFYVMAKAVSGELSCIGTGLFFAGGGGEDLLLYEMCIYLPFHSKIVFKIFKCTVMLFFHCIFHIFIIS